MDAHTERTISTLQRLKSTVSRLVFVTEVLFQLVLICYYAYTIWTHLAQPVFLALNALLLAFALFYLIFTFLARNREKRSTAKTIRKTTKKAINGVKWLIQIATVAFSVYELFAVDSSPVALIVTVFTAIGFIARVVVTCAYLIVSNYVKRLIAQIRENLNEAKQKRTAAEASAIAASLDQLEQDGQPLPDKKPQSAKAQLQEGVDRVKDTITGLFHKRKK